jgi:hypothetical protein
MKRLAIIAVFAAASVCFAQSKQAAAEAEEKDLRQALAEAGSSPLEFVRAIEKHLDKYPNSEQKPGAGDTCAAEDRRSQSGRARVEIQP